MGEIEPWMVKLGKMGKMKVPEPQTVKPEEAFPSTDIHIGGFWTRQRFPGLDKIILAGRANVDYWAVKPKPEPPPWTRPEFLSRHFDLVGWETWHWWAVAVPGTEDVDSARKAVSISIFRLCDRPVIVAVVSPWPWWTNPAVMKGTELRFYRLKWRLWWRRIDPAKDAKLRAILEGAMALDALAGRDL